MIDIHCHILPGIDDGPEDDDQALLLLQACIDDGITHVVMTPHVFPGRYDNRRSSIAQAASRFTALVAAQGMPVQLSCAGEVRFTPEVLDLLAVDELPYLGESAAGKAMLLEMPDAQIPLGAARLVDVLVRHGVVPVLVHPERNKAVMDNPQRLQPFIDQGCKLQLTAGSLVGQFGSRAQACAVALLDEGWVHAVASDAHNTRGRRPRMGDAATWLATNCGASVAHQLTVLGPAALCGLQTTQAAT